MKALKWMNVFLSGCLLSITPNLNFTKSFLIVFVVTDFDLYIGNEFILSKAPPNPL